MNPFRFLLLPFVAALLCVACGPKQPTSKPETEASTEIKPEYPIHIQLSESHEYKNVMPYTTLTDIATTDIQYIPLETTPDCLINGGGTGLRLSKEYIFIESGGILLQFDRKGKFIRKINKLGRGPEDCAVRTFGVDEKNRLIYTFDFYNVHILTFDGKYVRQLRDPFSEEPARIRPGVCAYDLEHGNLIFSFFEDGTGNEPYKYVVTDTAGTILYKCPNYTQFLLRGPRRVAIESEGGAPRLYKYNSSYYYQYEYNDTVFLIGKDYRCSPAYIRHLPNRTTLKDKIEFSFGVVNRNIFNGKNGLVRCFEDSKYLYVSHWHAISPNSGVGLLSLYDKATGTVIENINPVVSLLNNWDGGMNIPLYNSPPVEHQICRLLQPYDLKETLTDEYFARREIAHPEKAEALKQLVSTLKEDDNPVLMIITMK